MHPTSCTRHQPDRDSVGVQPLLLLAGELGHNGIWRTVWSNMIKTRPFKKQFTGLDIEF